MSNYTQAVTTEDNNGHLVWDTEGYYVVGDSEWQDITFVTTVTYEGGKIGIAPRVYEDNMYMSFIIENKTSDDTQSGSATVANGYAVLSSQVTYDSILLEEKEIPSLLIGQECILKAEVKSTNYKLYLNGVLIFNIEYSSMYRGRVGIYGTAGVKCSSIEVQANFADTWITNASSVNDGLVNIREMDNEDKYLYLSKASGTDKLYAEQEVDVVGGQDFTISFNAEGEGLVEVIEMNGAAPSTYQMTIPLTVWSPQQMVSAIKSDCTKVKVRFSVVTTSLKVNQVQLEDKEFSTAYIRNDSTIEAAVRNDSLVTYPSKNNIEGNRGSLSIWVKPSITYTSTSYRPVLVEYGDTSEAIRLQYNGSGISFKYGAAEVVGSTTFDRDMWYHIVATWSSTKLRIYVNNTMTELDIDHAFSGYSEVIRFGHSGQIAGIFNGAIDETIIYNHLLSATEIDAIYTATESIPDTSNMIMRATFNYAIGNFNKSIVEATLAPRYGSPIVVEKLDGSPMRKVSFFDYQTGEYTTYNEEAIEYDGLSDYLTISYKDIDVDNFKIVIKDVDDVIYGMPYRTDGYRVYMTLTPEEKKSLKRSTLYVTYQLNNAFTVDFNIGVADSFRVNLGKYDGEPVRITYEGNDFSSDKLATMVEMNPLLNPNNQGFLYVTRNVEKVTAFKVRSTPNDLVANGVDESMVVIEPLDSIGNFISHARLSVQAEKGLIMPAYDVGSMKMKDRSGRYIYRYRAPLIRYNELSSIETTDVITVIDEETGIGAQIQIVLSSVKRKSYVIQSGDTLNSIAEDNGTIPVDVAAENSKSLDDMTAYILSNVGATIYIPVNFVSTNADKTTIELEQETMIKKIIDYLIQYMGRSASQLPGTLGSILDFNNDGLIDYLEVAWVNDNKYTSLIKDKHTEIANWEKSNVG